MKKLLMILFLCSIAFTSNAAEPMRNLAVGIFSDINGKKSQDDTHCYGRIQGWDLYCIFDGHGGGQVSRYLEKNFLPHFDRAAGETIPDKMNATFASLDEEIRIMNIPTVGSTAVVLAVKKGIAYLANVGDSRGVIEKNKEVIAATIDHKVIREDEANRIATAGGIMFNGRIGGMLAVSRALGDWQYEKCDEGAAKKIVISTPECIEIPLTKEHRFAIVASDGLWNKMGNKAALGILHANRKRGTKDLNTLAKILALTAIAHSSTDNITVMVVDLLVKDKK